MRFIAKRAKYRDILSGIFLFRHISEKAVEEVFRSSACECFEFEPGEFIYTRTNFRKSLGVVLTGEVKAIKRGKDGNTILLNTFFSGGIFGVASLFQPNEGYVSEVQSARRSRILFLPEELLRALFRREPAAAENYIGYLASRICFLNKRIDIFTGGSAEQRLAGYLLSLCPEGGPCTFQLPITYMELSETLNIGRASLYRALDSLEASGVLRRSGKEITLLNPDVLRESV